MISFALSLIGRDRPGIVAAATEVLLKHGLNLTDSEMAVLRGEFAMMLIVSTESQLDEQALTEDLETLREQLELQSVVISRLPESAAVEYPAPSHIITVYGADHAGIVNAVTRTLADRDVNVVDLSTRLISEQDGRAIYVMILEAALPAGVAADQLNQLLQGVAEQQSIEITLRELDQDAL